MRTKDLSTHGVRRLVDALTFPLVVAAARWLAIGYLLALPMAGAIPWNIRWALLVYGAITTAFAAVYQHRDRGDLRFTQMHPLVVPALVTIDVAYAALITKLYGITLFVMIPALDLATLTLPAGLVVLVVVDAVLFAIAMRFVPSAPRPAALEIMSLTFAPYLTILYALYGRRRAERQVRAIDQVLNAGSELGAQLSLSDVLVQLLNLLGQFRRVVPWDTCVIYVVQYDEMAEEECWLRRKLLAAMPRGIVARR